MLLKVIQRYVALLIITMIKETEEISKSVLL